MTTPFAIDTEVDDGAGGSVDVVEDDTVVETGAGVDVVVEAAASVGVLESEHAAPSAIEAATSGTTAARRLRCCSVSGPSRA